MCVFVVLPSVDKASVASTTNAFASLTMDDRVSEEEEDEGGIPQELPEHACRCGDYLMIMVATAHEGMLNYAYTSMINDTSVVPDICLPLYRLCEI